MQQQRKPLNTFIMKLYTVLLPVLALTLSGCISGRSPVTAPSTPNRTGLKEISVLGGSTAAGAGIGYAISKDGTGAAIGGAAGLLTGAIVNNVLQDNQAQREAELMEAGRREERVRLQSEYWEAERYSKSGSTSGASGGRAAEVRYSGGYFEGINLAPRAAGDEAALTEPRRP